MASWSSARLPGAAPDNRPTIPPVKSNDSETSRRAHLRATIPEAQKTNGRTGIMAREEKKRNDENATFQGFPTASNSSCCSAASGPCDPSGRAEKLGLQSQLR